MNKKSKQIILDRIKVNHITGCWLWQKSCINDGYGRLRIEGKKILAHRLAYELWKGPIPKGLCVCHSCDNPKCCNPEHLWLGIHKENMIDMSKKDRSPRGEKCGLCKLTEDQIYDIRRLYDGNLLSSTKIAMQFGITQAQVSRIGRRIQWSHLKEREDEHSNF